jgi:hypothetical protein
MPRILAHFLPITEIEIEDNVTNCLDLCIGVHPAHLSIKGVRSVFEALYAYLNSKSWYEKAPPDSYNPLTPPSWAGVSAA